MHSLQPSAGSLDRGAKSGRAVPLSNLQFQVGTSYCRHSESLRLSSHRDRHTRACTPPGSDQDAAASQLSVLSKAEGRSPPWSFHFQHNERYLEWSDSAQEQLLRLHIAEKLKLDKQEVGQRLQHLDLILPDLVQRLPRLKADLLLELLSNTETLGSKLLVLKTSFPKVDIGRLAARFPMLLTDFEAGQLAETAEKLRASLPGVDVDELVEREPMVFSADVPRVLADVKRLLGSRMDPVKYFVANPRQVLDMQQGGMPSSAETGGDHDG